MDSSEDGLCQLIIQQGALPSEWGDEPLFHECLGELTACGLEKLSAEPRRLEEAHRHLQERNQELASSNYQTFIHTAECSKEIARDFQTVEEQLEVLLRRIPEFSASCEQFMTQAHDISAARRLSSLTLQKHTQVLEILEIPQLMDTCVRNAHYDEALELVAYVKRLERKHSTIPVVASIIGEVRRSTQSLLHQLIGQLKGELKLPACLKVIGYLRRMDVFTERELRLKFLQARDVWLQSLLQGIPREDAFHHITKVIEVTRVNIFDVITQYRAVFSDDDPLLYSGERSGGQMAHESALFHSWLALKIGHFLATLEADLLRGGDAVAGRIDTLLGQCMYFGLSFGRVGCDFRGRLPEIFHRAILFHLERALDAGVREFEEAIHRYSLSLPAGAAPSTRPPPLNDPAEVPPPMQLLFFPPLSLLANHILGALNRLRLCCALNLAREVCRCVHACLKACVRAVVELHRAEAPTFSAHEAETFAHFAQAMVDELLVHASRCLGLLFPARDLAAYLGVSRVELERRNFGRLDVEALGQPLRRFLPERKVTAPTEEPLMNEVETAKEKGRKEEEEVKTEALVAEKTSSADKENEETPLDGEEKGETLVEEEEEEGKEETPMEEKAGSPLNDREEEERNSTPLTEGEEEKEGPMEDEREETIAVNAGEEKENAPIEEGNDEEEEEVPLKEKEKEEMPVQEVEEASDDNKNERMLEAEEDVYSP